MPSVLIVDPQEEFTSPLADALRQKGLAITTVADGLEGLGLAQKVRPDAIVLAIEQRGMNGLSLCSRLRRDDNTRSIPMVLISLDATNFTTHRTSKSKADAYLAKPFSAIDLLGVLNNLIDVSARDTVSDLEVPPRVKAIHATIPPSHTNGRASQITSSSTADLLASDLPLPREDSGAELDWMVKLRQSIARRDSQIAELRVRIEEAGRMQGSFADKEKRLQEEVQKALRERDDTVKANMSMQEKLTSARLDLDDTKKRNLKEKKTLEERLAQVQKAGDDRASALTKQMEDKLGQLKKQSDDVISTLKLQLDETVQREAQKASSLEAANRQIKTLTQKLDETARNLDASKKSGAELKALSDKQTARIGQLDEDLKRSVADGEAKGQSIARLEDQLAKSQSDHAREVFALTEDLKATQAGSDAKSKTIVIRDDELAKMKANYEKRLASADDALRKANLAIESKTKQHARDVEARDASNAGLKQKVASLNEELAREKAEHDKMLEVAAEVHAKENNRIREDAMLRSNQVDAQHRDAIKKLEAEKNSVDAERQALEAQAIDLGKRLAAVEKQLSVTKQQLEQQHRDLLKKIEVEKATADAEQAILEADKVELTRRLGSLDKQLSLAKQELAEHEERNTELVEKLASAEGKNGEIDRVLAEGRRAKDELHSALGEIGRLLESARGAVRNISPRDE